MRLRPRFRLGILGIVLLLAGVAVLVIQGREERDLDFDAASADPDHADQDAEAVSAPQLHGRGRAETEAVTPSETASPPTGPTPWTLTATVKRREGGVPIQGATVRIWLCAWGDADLVGEGLTGPTGQVVLDLKSLSEIPRSRLAVSCLEGHASAPGHFMRRGMPEWVWRGNLLDDRLEPMPWSMEFTLDVSPVVRGQVLCGEEPLPSAFVRLAAADSQTEWGGFAFTGPDGRYALAIPGPGNYRVMSRRRDVETGSTDVFPVDGVTDVEVPSLGLQPLPEKRGVVQYEDGTPASDLAFEIDHPWFDVHHDPWIPSLGRIRVRSDSRGSFAVVFPRVEDMGGRLKGDFTVAIPGVEAEQTGFDPQATNLEITLPPHRLRVQLRNAEGSRLPAMKVSFFPDGERWCSASGSTDEHGQVSLFVGPGERGNLFVLGAGHSPITKAVEVPETGNESAVVLDIPDPRASGTLALRMRTPAGQSVFPVKVCVDTPEGYNVVVEAFNSDSDRVALVPGTYSVRLMSKREHPSWKDVPAMRSMLKLDEGVVVRERETTTLDVQWTPTAALAVKFLVFGETVSALEESQAYLEAPGGEGCRVSLVSGGGRSHGPLPANKWLFSRWLQDPGSYVLTIKASGFRTIAREVRLVAEEVTWVEVTMEREP